MFFRFPVINDYAIFSYCNFRPADPAVSSQANSSWQKLAASPLHAEELRMLRGQLAAQMEENLHLKVKLAEEATAREEETERSKEKLLALAASCAEEVKKVKRLNEKSRAEEVKKLNEKHVAEALAWYAFPATHRMPVL